MFQWLFQETWFTLSRHRTVTRNGRHVYVMKTALQYNKLKFGLLMSSSNEHITNTCLLWQRGTVLLETLLQNVRSFWAAVGDERFVVGEFRFIAGIWKINSDDSCVSLAVSKTQRFKKKQNLEKPKFHHIFLFRAQSRTFFEHSHSDKT